MRFTPGEVIDRAFLLSDHLANVTEQGAAAYGLTVPRLQLLFVLGHEGECKQTKLAAHLGCSPRQVTALVDGLVASGHVTRRIPEGDRRVRLVAPTARAREIVAELDTARLRLAAKLLAGVDEQDCDTFAAVAESILERMGRDAPTRLPGT